MRSRSLVVLGILCLVLASCTRIPTPQEANEVMRMLQHHGGWAWAPAVALLWADVFLPIPQTAVIAVLGLIYGPLIGGLVGSFGLITGGLLGYGLMLTSARRFAQRFAGRSLQKMEGFFERRGAWAIILTRSLPYSTAEAAVFLAGLARMPLGRFLVALTVGSVPIAFAFAAMGAGWEDQPLLALAASYVLPILLLPIALFLLRSRER
jgi:uncharacterized membrane protein YdjX (TVP38/TMEM64 family)